MIALIVGARPNLVKAAALVDAHRGRFDWALELVHTGQHYDDRLTTCFFDQLGLPAPAVNLAVGAGSANVQTARILERLETRFTERRPAAVVVVGDVTSTLAAALAVSRMSIPVAHVEAGLRSFDRSMPEEMNRRLTDAVADLHFVTEPSGICNLEREGIEPSRIHFVGNPMIDTLIRHRPRAERLHVCRQWGLESNAYVLVTLHRPSNVDDDEALRRVMAALESLAAARPVLFPVHPRTARRLRDIGGDAARRWRITMVDPQPYLEFLSLTMDAGAVLTDSGGVQEETTALGIPCVTMRDSTERPITIDVGTNTLGRTDPFEAAATVQRVFGRRAVAGRQPEKWDGRAGERILDILDRSFCRHTAVS